MKKTLPLVTLASCVTALCHAASPSAVPDTLLACRKLPDESERARCYDAQIDKLNAPAVSKSAPAQAAPPAQGAPPAPSSSATATTATKQSSAAKFGEEQLPARSRPAAKSKDEAALLSSITALRAVAPETYAISLANGQVWRQDQASQMTMFFHVGDDVRIEKGALGSYHMSTATAGSKNWVRVTRIQ